MAREIKSKTIDELQEIFSKCSIGILTDYRGISGPQMTELRRKLREMGIGYRVVKDTLARFAAERTGKQELASSFLGQTAIAFGYGDIAEPAKALTDYIRATKSVMTIKAGFLGTRLLTAKEVNTLTTLPPRDILLSKVLGGMQSPIVALASCLASPIRGMMGVLQARMKQLEVK